MGPATPTITPSDRLGLTLCLAIIVHAVVVLGVTFTPEPKQPQQFQPLEIILVQKQSEPPEKAKLLAQADLKGGGESEEPDRPTTPMPAPFPEPVARLTAPPPAKPVPPPSPAAELDPEPASEPVPKPTPVAVETPEPAPEPEPEPEPKPKPTPTPEPVKSEPEPEKTTDPRIPPTPPTPSASELVSRSLEMAALSAEIQRKLKARAERPRHTYISASSKEYKYAAYMEAWRAKVERIGNLNYPEEARSRGLTGSLILDVALKPDGSVQEITIRRSSGTRLLDDAAIRIVKLAAPFAPFPEDIRADTDILHITRTWRFLQGNRFL